MRAQLALCRKPDTMANPRSHCVCKTSPLKEPVGVNLFVRETERRVQDNRSRGHRPVLVNRAGIGPHALGANRNIRFFLDLAAAAHSGLRPTWEWGRGGAEGGRLISRPVTSTPPSPTNSSTDLHSQFSSVMSRPAWSLHSPPEAGPPVPRRNPIARPSSGGFLSAEEQEV